MIELREIDGGVVLPVKAQAGSRQNELRGEQQGALKVAVTQVAEKGKANRAILAVLATALELRKSQLELISGLTSGRKEVLIRGLNAKQLQTRLRNICPDSD